MIVEDGCNQLVSTDDYPHDLSLASTPFTRRFQPDSVSVDELVEAIYQLLVNAQERGSKSTCFSEPNE